METLVFMSFQTTNRDGLTREAAWGYCIWSLPLDTTTLLTHYTSQESEQVILRSSSFPQHLWMHPSKLDIYPIGISCVSQDYICFLTEAGLDVNDSVSKQLGKGHRELQLWWITYFIVSQIFLPKCYSTLTIY